MERGHAAFSLRRQSELVGVPRSGLYDVPAEETAANLQLMRTMGPYLFRQDFGLDNGVHYIILAQDEQRLLNGGNIPVVGRPRLVHNLRLSYGRRKLLTLHDFSPFNSGNRQPAAAD